MSNSTGSRFLDRALRPLSKVHPGEGLVAIMMLACVFLILTSYYVMKTAREGLILAGGTFGLRGDELKTYATGAMALLLVGVVPAYGLLANRVRRIRLINICYAIVIGSLLGFFVLGRAGVPVGLAFFIWLGLVSVFLIAQFWSYANDIYSEEQGKRLFAIIAVGGSLGAMLGPRVAKLADTFTLMPIAATVLVVCLALFNGIEHLHRRQPENAQLCDAPLIGGGGFSLVLRDRYLLLIATMLLVLNLINTTGEYILSNAVREHAASLTADPDERREIIKAFYADFFSWVNLIAFLLQAFVVSRVIDKIGVRRALFVMPVVVFGAYGAIAIMGGLALVRIAKTLDNSIDYSLQNTVRQSLFLPTTRAVKFKAKAAIDTFFVRAGDTMSALLVGVGIHQLGLGARQLAIVNVGLVVVWLAICAAIARRHRALSRLATPEDTSPTAPPVTPRPRLVATTAIVVCVLFSGPALADPPTPDGDDSHTAAEVANAPLPGDESGRVDGTTSTPSAARRAGRAALFVPRIALEVAFAPVRASIYATEKYYLVDRLYDVFFDDSRTIGAYPTLELESGFGATAGAKAVHRDLLGAREHLSLTGAFGGRYRTRVATSLRSGRRFGRVGLELAAELDRRPEEPFYGIGNGDEVGLPVMPIDPRISSSAVETRYRQQLARVATRIDTALTRHAHAQLAGSITDLEFARSEQGAPIDDVYVPHGLVGYRGTRQAYAELELRWDSRRAFIPWEPAAFHSLGTFASAFAGRSTAIDGSGTSFWRIGFDLQRYWRIAAGPRTLVTRVYGEAVDRPASEVPFADLPLLGGKTLLRGYPTDRFRDRVALLGSVEYQWDLVRQLAASLFVDAGRVVDSADTLDLEHVRIGYGVGLQVYTSKAFVMRTSLASSVDGGVYFHFAFEPVFESRTRTERR